MKLGIAHFRSLLVVSCLSFAVENLMDLTDMAIAGNLLGETGLAGVEVYGVMTELLYFAGIIVANGSANFFAAAAGRFDKSDMTRWFSNGLVFAIACGVFCSLVSLFLCKPYLSFVGIGGATLVQARSYWLWYGFQALVQPLAVYLAALVYERPVRTVGLGREGGLVAFTGATVAHDEIVSIPAYLTVRDGGRVVYRPESRFIYRACAAARASVAEIVASGKPPRGHHLITADEIASGGEAVGVLVTLLNGEAVYVGTRYDLADVPRGETPTVFQVAAGCHAALCHVLANPHSGPRFPEELDTGAFLASSELPVRVIRTRDFGIMGA